ncbi:alpha/beta hydrolase [Schlesneria sp.]|uniref:alpha/beta hydrolase n=1 Tax=Schlesneria sp. TaxID=2762018 RepID=UPI002EF17BCC
MTDTTESPPSRKKGPRLLRALFLYGGIPYFSILVLFTVFQRKLMYQPTIAADLSTSNVKLAPDIADDVHIKTLDGYHLKGWLVRGSKEDPPAPSLPLVIYFPGNAGNRHERLADLLEIAHTGFDVLIFDYRGYGDSTGKPSESALTTDAQLVWKFACNELNYAPQQIVVFGESLGGAVALSLWSTESDSAPQPAAVLLNSTFATMGGAVAWHYPCFPFQFLLLDRWRSIDRIPRVPSPVVIFHGSADEIVPFSEGQRLAGQSRNAQFIEIADGTHNAIPMNHLRTQLIAVRNRIRESTEAAVD